jgi:predicted MFS family arabinose efflux permease
MTRLLKPSLLVFVAAALAVGLALPACAQACPMCGSALGDDPLGRAFGWSIVFMIAAPYTAIGGAAAWLFYMHRRAPGRRRGDVIDLVEAGRNRPPVKA